MRFKDSKNQETVLLHNPLASMVCTAAYPKYCSGAAHLGTDWRCSIGTPIYAAEDGTVRWAQVWDGKTKTGDMSYGNACIITHANYQGGKLETVYAHLSKLNVKRGQAVKEGDIIGWSGNSGNSFGCHLHFEVRWKGTKRQPLCWLGGGFSWASDAVRKSSGAYTSVVAPATETPKVYETQLDRAFTVGLEVQQMSGGDKTAVLALLDKLGLKYREVG